MLRPISEDELAEAIASAQEPLHIQGGGTRGMSVHGEPLTTAGISGITLYEPGALTIVAKAGTPVAEIEAALDAENQMLAFEPMDCRTLLGTEGEPTIGGVVATNTSGPRRVQSGACRDFLLGVRFVDGAGVAISNGGRVMKNVTGYDLARLMCGAHGTLGVLTEVSLKVLPRPETESTLLVTVDNAVQAVEAMSRAMTSPFEVSGAAFGPDKTSKQAMIRLEGFADSVKYRAGELTKVLESFGAIETLDGAASQVIWRNVRDVAAFADKPVVTAVSLKPSDYDKLEMENAPYEVLLDRAGGLAWVASEEAAQVEGKSLHAWLQDFSAMNGGHSTLIKGTGTGSRFQPEKEPLATMAASLRAKYDPKGILNTGLMG